MQITYFDEVKYNPPRQPYYWLCALVADAEMIWAIDTEMAQLSEECFGRATLTRETEFHAADIFHRKRNFKSQADPAQRNNVLKQLLLILNKEHLGKIQIRIDPARMVKPDYEEMAFLFLCEKLEQFLRSHQSPGILIGDRDNDDVTRKFSEVLSQYRDQGTPYQFGTELRCLIDTVHFTQSHYSRMLQLADMYTWVSQLQISGDATKRNVGDLKTFVNESTQWLGANKYKHWPTEHSWIQVSST